MKKLLVLLPVLALLAIGCNSEPEENFQNTTKVLNPISDPAVGVDSLIKSVDESISQQETLDTAVDPELLDSDSDVLNEFSEVTDGKNF